MQKEQRNSTRAGGRKNAGPPRLKSRNGNPAATETVGSSADVPVATLSLHELLDAVGDLVRQESLKVASSVSARQLVGRRTALTVARVSGSIAKATAVSYDKASEGQIVGSSCSVGGGPSSDTYQGNGSGNGDALPITLAAGWSTPVRE